MIKSIEDLQVWQKARSFNKKVYEVSGVFPTHEKNNLVSQLRRASASICANVAEGFGRYNYQESIQFYRTARGSLLEVKSHLYLSFDQEYIAESDFEDLINQINEIGRMLNGLINNTKNYRIGKVSAKL